MSASAAARLLQGSVFVAEFYLQVFEMGGRRLSTMLTSFLFYLRVLYIISLFRYYVVKVIRQPVQTSSMV